ncbi:hypothetical protein ACFWPJ_30360, partial [Nocardia sp. NPDC058497]
MAAVLLDGLDLVVLGLGGLAVPPARCRVLAARARNRGATLVVAGGTWTNPSLRLDTRVTGYRGRRGGRGRPRAGGRGGRGRAPRGAPPPSEKTPPGPGAAGGARAFRAFQNSETGVP